MEESKERAPRNRTLTLTPQEVALYQKSLLTLNTPVSVGQVENRTICQDMEQAVGFLPEGFVDLLIIDPPYNLEKRFGESVFRKSTLEEYRQWFLRWFVLLLKTLKPSASVYVCSDWRCSSAVHDVLSQFLTVRNRITWEREKGRGAERNWKNCSEDIWFATVGADYTFNVDAVRLKRRVIAPYRDSAGNPRDWEQTGDGSGVRLTAPSNLWSDITVPFWSMPENTDHPTQKPEKLIAKLVLASSQAGDLVMDPFLGSGTTSVVAAKLKRRYVGIEKETSYCCMAEKRLQAARCDKAIQGYADGVFWERNSLPQAVRAKENDVRGSVSLFDDLTARNGLP